jgi:potassium/hydrogen antiporter
MPLELHTTEIAILAIGVLLLASVLAGRIASRSGVPVLVLFLAVGMLAGSEGVGRIFFEDYSLAYRVGSIALVLILFDGGLGTPVSVLRSALGPASALATVGVLLTAGAVGVAAHAFGSSWTEALLLGAIVSSTDAAAVFSVLRGGGVHLRPRVGALIEVESGLNDPMAVILTMALVSAAAEHRAVAVVPLVGRVALQLGIGAAIGVAVALVARELMARVRLRILGVHPIVTLSFALITFGAAALAHGSGFLAVYVAGVTLGNAQLPNAPALRRAHDFVAWTGQIVMFVVLGLLVFPSRLVAVAPTGLVLAALLAFVARPVAVAVCLLPFGFSLREIVLVGWVGLRGAVPIILAVIPVLAHVTGAARLFDIVFFVVLVSALLQGTTARWLTGKLALHTSTPPAPEAALQIESTQALGEEILSLYVDRASPMRGKRLRDVSFPDRSSVMLVVRGSSLLAPRGSTELMEGDHVFVFCPRESEATVREQFGAPLGDAPSH